MYLINISEQLKLKKFPSDFQRYYYYLEERIGFMGIFSHNSM
jgi:hypothetical protein